MIFSVSRTLALWEYYHAPMTIAFRFETEELPRLLNTTGHITLPTPGNKTSYRDDEDSPRIDYGPLKDFGLRLCIGKEWYRFPGHYLIPDGVRVDWIKSDFDGMLPGHFPETKYEGGLIERVKGTRVVPHVLNDLNKEAAELYVSRYLDCNILCLTLRRWMSHRAIISSTLTSPPILGSVHMSRGIPWMKRRGSE